MSKRKGLRVLLIPRKASLAEIGNEIPLQAGFRKGNAQKTQIFTWLINVKKMLNTHWIIEKAREFQRNIYFCFTD